MTDDRSADRSTVDESRRQEAVDELRSALADHSAQLQAVVEEVARSYQVPMAMISVLDHDRQWFAARVGIDLEETARSDALCLHALMNPAEPLVVLDTLADVRIRTNRYVVGPPNVRFYVGVPILDRGGAPVGALCILDREPHTRAPDLFNILRLTRQIEQVLAN